METTNCIATEQKREIFAIEYSGVFIKSAKYVGYMQDQWGRNGRTLLAVGRTKEEAIMLSRNKLSVDGIWRLEQYIKLNNV